VASAGPPLISGIVATDKWLTRFRTSLVALLGATVLGIACLAFYTSFEAIRAYAVRSNGIAPEHGWAVPLMVDSFIVVALGADLWFTTTKMRRAWWEVWWPKLLLAGAAGVSFILNVAHAEPTPTTVTHPHVRNTIRAVAHRCLTAVMALPPDRGIRRPELPSSLTLAPGLRPA